MDALYKELARIQKELKAPKNQYNNHGHYHYRSCEDILEGLKNIKGDCIVTLTDQMVEVGGRVYVRARATIALGKESMYVEGFAREPAERRKGMEESQMTGAASTYARKYALNGLFLIDDTKDADTEQFAQQATHNSGAEDKARDMFDKYKSAMTPEQANYTYDLINSGKYQDAINYMKGGK